MIFGGGATAAVNPGVSSHWTAVAVIGGVAVSGGGGASVGGGGGGLDSVDN